MTKQGRTKHIPGKRGYTLCGEHAHSDTLVDSVTDATCYYCADAWRKDFDQHVQAKKGRMRNPISLTHLAKLALDESTTEGERNAAGRALAKQVLKAEGAPSQPVQHAPSKPSPKARKKPAAPRAPKRKSPTPRKKAKAAPKKRKAAGREANPVRTTDRVQWAMNYINHVSQQRNISLYWAALNLRRNYPDVFAYVLDVIGMHPSSEPQLRAMQEVFERAA